MDKLIKDLFATHWSGELAEGAIQDQRKQLHKNLQDQVNGFWSGHSAYAIMTKGGFLVDSKRIRMKGGNGAQGKKLTERGKVFMESMEIEDAR